MLALSLCLTAGAQNAPDAGPKVSAKARQIHDSAIVIDTHADTPQRFLDECFDIGTSAGTGSIDLQKAGAGNLGAEFFSIWVEPGYFDGHYAQRAMDLIDSSTGNSRRRRSAPAPWLTKRNSWPSPAKCRARVRDRTAWPWPVPWTP